MPPQIVSTRLRNRAREQRRAPTLAEEGLWRALRANRFGGLKFRRQVPIGLYVVDFICFEARLIVELDGPPHDDPIQRDRDERRDQWLRAQGFEVLRFSNDLILGGSGELVLETILRVIRHQGKR